MTVADMLAVLLAALFLLAGLIKFIRPLGNAADAARWRVPVYFVKLVGVAEIMAAPLLLVPATRPYSAGFLALIMLGAIVMQIRVRGWLEIIHPTVTLGVLLLLASGVL